MVCKVSWHTKDVGTVKKSRRLMEKPFSCFRSEQLLKDFEHLNNIFCQLETFSMSVDLISKYS